MKFRKIMAGVSALALSGSMVSAIPLQTLAAGTGLTSVDEAVTWLCDAGVEYSSMKNLLHYQTTVYEGTVAAGYTVENPKNLPQAPSAERFDLRDVNGKNYVTPVKSQHPYGTCWAFACTAAAESSIAYETGWDANTATPEQIKAFDFSERHLAWFASNPLPENNSVYASQAGEGKFSAPAENIRNSDDFNYSAFNTAIFSSGGHLNFGSTLFSSFIGPTFESAAPYHGKDSEPVGVVFVFDLIAEPTEPFTDIFDIVDYVTPESLEPIEYHSAEEFKELTEDTLGQIRDNTVQNMNWYHGLGKYYNVAQVLMPSADSDWSVDESLRFSTAFELERSCILPCPALSDRNNAYQFNEAGINAIKQELVNGRAVSICFLADQSMPGDTLSGAGYLSFVDKNGNKTDDSDNAAYWCHYTYDATYDPTDPNSVNKRPDPNHAVTIVGYDDTIPKEYFNDPNGTIGGDGAFIAKNSWGTTDIGNRWGNDGTGYFYLSYYDQSLSQPESFDFMIQTEESVKENKYSAVTPQMYDLMPSKNLDEIAFSTDAAMANVFTASNNIVIRTVGYTATSCNEDVHYDVYLLNEDAKNPTDGVLAATADDTYAYAGYQRTDLDTPVKVKEGQRYSIVVTAKREDGNYGVSVKGDTNKKKIDVMYDALMATATSEEDRAQTQAIWDQAIYPNQTYVNAVVNPGESFLMVNDEWTDWSDVIAKVHEDPYGQVVDYDNFSIKAYADSEMIHVTNQIKEPKESYKAGDVVDCQIIAANIVSTDMDDLDFCINGKSVAKLDKLVSGEEKTIDYQYTVTEEDVVAGEFATNTQIFMDYLGTALELNLIDGFSQTKLVVSLKNETVTPTEEATEVTETTTGTSESSTGQPTEKKVYTADSLCEMAIKDYEVRTGIKPETAESNESRDGTVAITLKDGEGKILDSYIINKDTAVGTDSAGKTIDLPQTGNNNPFAAAAAAVAAGLTIAGTFLTVRVLRKKED